MSDSREDSKPPNRPEDAGASERQKEFTRRALLRAGWVAPLVTTVNIPSASAQTTPPHIDTHSDTPHSDSHVDIPHTDNIAIHADIHVDTPEPPHDDHLDIAEILTRRMTTTPTAECTRTVTGTRTRTTTTIPTATATTSSRITRTEGMQTIWTFRITQTTPTRAATRITQTKGTATTPMGHSVTRIRSITWITTTPIIGITMIRRLLTPTIPTLRTPIISTASTAITRMGRGVIATTPIQTTRTIWTTATGTIPMPAIRTRPASTHTEITPTSSIPIMPTAFTSTRIPTARRRTSIPIPMSTETAFDLPAMWTSTRIPTPCTTT